MRTVTALLITMMALISSQASAEQTWEYVGGGQAEGEYRILAYIDTSSIKRTGSVVRYWGLAEYENNPDGWEKDLTLFENDCAGGRSRMLQISVYFLNGGHQSQELDGLWRYVTPGTLGAKRHGFVCPR